MLFDVDESTIPEWMAVRQAVHETHEAATEAWTALACCHVVELFTDGFAPLRNPGGPTGSAVVAVGYTEPVDLAGPEHPAPAARLDVGVHTPGSADEPRTSNIRAEQAGVLAALAVLADLTRDGAAVRQAAIRCDNKTVVNRGAGAWTRKSNLDLWAIHDRLERAIAPHLARPFVPDWMKGHAGAAYNEAANETVKNRGSRIATIRRWP